MMKLHWDQFLYSSQKLTVFVTVTPTLFAVGFTFERDVLTTNTCTEVSVGLGPFVITFLHHSPH